jgi:hypothetical protein
MCKLRNSTTTNSEQFQPIPTNSDNSENLNWSELELVHPYSPSTKGGTADFVLPGFSGFLMDSQDSREFWDSRRTPNP